MRLQKEGPSLSGQPDPVPPLLPEKQLRPQLLLQRLQPAAQRRLGDIQLFRRGRHRAVLRNPMSDEELFQKFQDCCRYAAKPMSEETVKRIFELCMHLEELADIRELTALLN